MQLECSSLLSKIALNSNPTQFALTSRRVITSSGECHVAILVRGNSILDVVAPTEIPSAYTVDDVGDLVVMPGLVDSHVHINEPGRTEWEGFETATRAAAAGGITTLVDMPLNSSPVTTTRNALEQKIAAAHGKLTVDCGFYAGLIPGNTNDIEPLIEAGVLGVKAFLVHSGIDDFPNVTEKDLRCAMPIIATHDVPLLVHCELTLSPGLSPKLGEGWIPTESEDGERVNPRSYAHYLASRPRAWEHAAIELMIRLAREYSCKVHIVHVSSADAIPRIRDAKSGPSMTAETCPHYLFFSSEEIPDGDTRFKCAPPVREKENRERLWKALDDGVLDMIVSDHSPSVPALKCPESGDFQKAWGGIASLQFGLSIIWTEASKRGHSFEDIARWMSERPAHLVSLKQKGKIAPGFDADFVVWNPEGSFTIEPSMIYHKHKLTPYEGQMLRGVVEKTILRGQTIYERGHAFREPRGKTLVRSQQAAA
ncbi:MAG: allantoinase AllB [Ignavibacteria bacterium]|nr:allantoinase AllB [Ignavibacteria bacterium]